MLVYHIQETNDNDASFLDLELGRLPDTRKSNGVLRPALLFVVVFFLELARQYQMRL
jgi:hypothetical protein